MPIPPPTIDLDRAAPWVEPRPAGPVIRHAEPSDAPAIDRLFAEPSVLYWTHALPYMPMTRHDPRLVAEAPGRTTLVALVDGELAGMLGLGVPTTGRVRHTARIGPVAVGGAWQGQGVGSALMAAAIDLADNWLALVRLDLVVYTDNAPAIALYRKFGFVEEGVHRAAFVRAGHYVDVVTMARVRLDRPAPGRASGEAARPGGD